MMKTDEFWNKRADTYDASVNVDYARAYQQTVKITKEYLKKEDRVLDYGCGTGIVTHEIAPLVSSIVATDISERMLALAKSKTFDLKITNITYLLADLNDPRIRDDHFDVITAFNVLYFMEDLDSFLKAVHAMLPINGYFLSVTDCLGEKNSIKAWGSSLLMKWGVFPYLNFLSIAGLTGKIENAGFEIQRVENLYTNPPNLYVAARKWAS